MFLTSRWRNCWDNSDLPYTKQTQKQNSTPATNKRHSTVQNNTQLRKESNVVRQKVSIVGGVLVVLFAISRHEIEIHAWTTNATCKDAFEWEIEDLI